MLTVAFATSDGDAVDQHFGWCRRFDVYELDTGTARLVESRLLDARLLDPADDDEQRRISGRLAAVRGVAVLHVTHIGGTAAAAVVGAGIHPITVAVGTPVAELVARLQAVLAGSPPPWLRKALRPAGRPAAWRPTQVIAR